MMNHKVKVSVIVPNYNHGKYLEKRLESIVNQTFQDFELIILDDCSSDDSKKIIESYRTHPKITHIVYNEKNSGSTFKQWKKGIELSNGEYVWIAESDDLSDLGFLKTMVTILEQDQNLSLAFCDSTIIDLNGKEISTFSTQSGIAEILKDKLKISPCFTKGNNIYNSGMCVFRKIKIPENTLNCLTEYEYCGDWFLWSTLAKHHHIAHCHLPLNFFRKSFGSVSNMKEVKGLRIIEGLEIVIEMSGSFLIDYSVLRYWLSQWSIYLSNYKSRLTIMEFITINFKIMNRIIRIFFIALFQNYQK